MGGWLAALIVVIGVIAPAIWGVAIKVVLNGQAELARYGAEGVPAWSHLNALWKLELAKLIIALVIAGPLLFVRTRAVIHFAILGIWVQAVGMVFAGAMIGTPVWRIPLLLGEGLVLAIPTTLYLLRSRRVANTYRPRPDPAAIATIFE